jgi:hypothetical protein
MSFAEGVTTNMPPIPLAPLGIPTLVVSGSLDEIALGADELARRLDADYVQLTGRTHTNAIAARAFKEAELEHLNASSMTS